MKNMIFPLAIFSLMVCCLPVRANAELSGAEKDFLSQKHVSQDDIDVIPKLSKETQAEISAWIAAKDHKKLACFKDSRGHYREVAQLKPGVPMPRAPIGWRNEYLTTDEHQRYIDICEKAPW